MGKVTVVGGARAVVPVAGTPLSDLAVGSIIKLNESGSPVDYIVVNQGIPSNSSLYDASCNGTWLLRKDCCERRVWNSSYNTYDTSDIHSWLNGIFVQRLDNGIQSAIKTVQIPMGKGYGSSTVVSGTSGLYTDIFLLSAIELGVSSNANLPVDGAVLSYFSGSGNSNANRKAYIDGSVCEWWTRTPNSSNIGQAWFIGTGGSDNSTSADMSKGIRPALILPQTVLVKDDGAIKV